MLLLLSCSSSNLTVSINTKVSWQTSSWKLQVLQWFIPAKVMKMRCDNQWTRDSIMDSNEKGPGSVMLQAIHVDVTNTTNLNIVAYQAHPSWTVFPKVSGFFQQDPPSCHTVLKVQEWFEELTVSSQQC